MNAHAVAGTSRRLRPIGSSDVGPRSSHVGSRRATLLALVGVIVVGAALRFWRIGHQSFWYDESATLVLVHHSLSRMLSILPHSEGTPPVYYCVLWVWARVFGFTEAGLRSLSAIAGVAVIPVMYGIGSTLMSRRAGLVAAALAATNPFLIWYSQEARSYSLLVLTSALSLLAFAHLLSPRASGRWLVSWSIAAALALATHYYAVLTVAPQAIWLAWLHRRDLRVWLAIYSVAAVGVVLLLLALSQLKRPDAAWISKLSLGRRLGQIAPQFLLGTGTPDRVWLTVAGVLALLLAIALLVLRADRREQRGALLAGALAAAGFLLSLLLIVASDNVITRNLVVVLIALILLFAGGLGASRAGLLGLAGVATLCAIGVIATSAVAVDGNLQRPAWRDLAHVLRTDHPPVAASAILEENAYLGFAGNYIPGLYTMRTGTSVGELDVVAADNVPSVALCWWGAACSLPRARLNTSIQIPGFRPAGPVVRVQEFAVYRLRATTPVVLTPAQIARAASNARLTSYGVLVQPPA